MTKLKAKIAIIEDDSAISNMYLAKLSSCGYDVKVAENGQVGLKLINDFKPDVVLLDLMMPVMNGIEVLEALKNQPVRTTAKIIVLSNMGDSVTDAKVASYNVAGRIVKVELTPAQVAERVEQVLAK